LTIKVNVRRPSLESGSMDNLGDHEFVIMPREGEIVTIDGAAEGEVQRVEHLIAPGKPPEVTIFIDN
jgi:hypothetical protein